MTRRIRPLIAHVGNLLEPRPPVRTLFSRDGLAARAEAEVASEELGHRDAPRDEGDRDVGVVEQ